MAEHGLPWVAGSATGIGSYPGDDPAEALRVVLGELPDLPHLPELPGRGPGADLVGRTAALLVEMPVHLQPTGWRLTDRPGGELSRARSYLSRDLDALTDLAGDYQGPLKIQVAGPWTLAAAIELPRGEPLLADPGAVRDLTGSLAEGVAAHVAEVRRRVPGAQLLVQVDEPSLPRVLAGAVPTASGLNRVRPVEGHVARQALADVIDAAGAFPIVHCCAAGVPYALLRSAGARAIAVDFSLVHRADGEAIAESVEAGTGLLLGVLPGDGGQVSDPADTVKGVRRMWRDLGFRSADLAERVVVTPACGMAGASPGGVRDALACCREAGHVLRDAPDL